MNMKEKGRTVSAMDWLDAKLTDATFAAEVDAELAALRLEDDLMRLREASGLSQRELARRLGVSQPFVAKLESGRVKNLELRTLVRTVAALGGEVRVVIAPRRRQGRPTSARKRGLRAGGSRS